VTDTTPLITLDDDFTPISLPVSSRTLANKAFSFAWYDRAYKSIKHSPWPFCMVLVWLESASEEGESDASNQDCLHDRTGHE
jgi:hypothetical protein